MFAGCANRDGLTAEASHSVERMQISDPLIVALEGPSDSGKSTLATGLRDACETPIVLLPCYSDLVTDDAALPPDRASNIDAQLRDLEFFLDLDRRRRSETSRIAPGTLVIADRCWLSLLAHVYAVEHTGGPAAYGAARRRAQELAGELLQPHLVLILAVEPGQRRSRVDRRDKHRWFTCDGFNEQLDTFLANEAPGLAPCVVRTLDASPEAPVVRRAAVRAIAAHLEGATP
jgi:thymidylate kinase